MVCHKLLESGAVPGGELVTGHYFARSTDTISDHGWIAFSDGTILDPTRWCMEDENPAIYLGPRDDCYDLGSARWDAEVKEIGKSFAYTGLRAEDMKEMLGAL